MLLVPDFIKGIAAKGLARKLATRLGGDLTQEGGPSPKVHVHGQHRGLKVEVFLAVTWGHVAVTVSTQPKGDLYFRLRSSAALKRMAPGRDRDYEALDFASGLVMSWSRDDHRLDARRIVASLDPGLRERMLSTVKGNSGWSHTADGLECDRAVSVFSGPERVIEALDLACDVAQGIEALAAQPGFRNADSA